MKNLINEKAKIIWEDYEKVSQRIGNIISFKEGFVMIETEQKIELIPIQRILRIELKGGIKTNE